jgi:hypothetical protein
MITNQNKKHNKSFIHMEPAKKIKKPARIPPQTPPARGQMQKQKSAEVLPNPNPQKIGWRNRVRISPRHTARILGGQNPKKKNVLSILEKITPAKIRKSKEHFLFGVAE